MYGLKDLGHCSFDLVNPFAVVVWVATATTAAAATSTATMATTAPVVITAASFQLRRVLEKAVLSGAFTFLIKFTVNYQMKYVVE